MRFKDLKIGDIILYYDGYEQRKDVVMNKASHKAKDMVVVDEKTYTKRVPWMAVMEVYTKQSHPEYFL